MTEPARPKGPRLRKLNGSGDPRAMGFFAAALWSLGVTLLAALVIEVVDKARAGAENDLVNVAACATLAYSLVVFAIFRVYAADSSSAELMGLGRPRARDLVAGALVGAGASRPFYWVGDAWDRRFPLTSASDDAAAEELFHHVVGGRVTLILVLVFVLPLLSELFYRGAIFGGLSRGRSLGLAIVASAIFSAAPSSALPMWIAFGLILGWGRAVTGTTWAALVARVAFEAVRLAPLFVSRDIDADLVSPRWTWGASAAALAVGLAGWKLAAVKSSSRRASED